MVFKFVLPSDSSQPVPVPAVRGGLRFRPSQAYAWCSTVLDLGQPATVRGGNCLSADTLFFVDVHCTTHAGPCRLLPLFARPQPTYLESLCALSHLPDPDPQARKRCTCGRR